MDAENKSEESVMDFLLRLFSLGLTKSIMTWLNATVNPTLACGCLKKLEINQKG